MSRHRPQRTQGDPLPTKQKSRRADVGEKQDKTKRIVDLVID